MHIKYEAILEGPIEYQNKEYILNYEIPVKIEICNPFLSIDAKSIGVHGYGECNTTAISCFGEMFDFQYKSLVINKDNQELSDEAIKVRNNLKDLVKEVKVYND